MEEQKESAVLPKLPPGMKIYYLGYLLKGPNWTTERTPDIAHLQEAHLSYLLKLKNAGKLLIYGPILDEGNMVGFSVFQTDSLEETRTLAETDPAVIAGRFTIEVHPWMSFEGIGIVPH